MKNYLPLFAFLLMVSALSAQVTLHEETFDGSAGSWSVVDVVGDQTWEPREFDGMMFMQMNGYDGAPFDNEDWLISPSIDLEGTTGEELSFQSAANFSGPQLELLISNNYEAGENPNDANWTDLTDQASWSATGYEEVQSGGIDLSGFNGTVNIAFKYTSSPAANAKLWQIDNVLVIGEDGSSTNEIREKRFISTPVVNGTLLQFDILDPSLEYEFSIYNIAGRQLNTFAREGVQTNVSVYVADLADGVYVLSIQTSSGVKSYQFVK